MLRRLSICLLSMLILTACRHAQETVSSQVNEKKIAPFCRILVNGSMNVNIDMEASSPKVDITGDPRDLQYLQWHITNGLLVINLGKGYPHYGPVTANLHTRCFTGLTYHGKGLVKGTHLKTNVLDLKLANQNRTILSGDIGLRTLEVKGPGLTEIKGIKTPCLNINLIGKPRVTLAGLINVNYLNLKGNGWLEMYWIKSKNLKIRGKNSVCIQLAGIVQLLDVELWNKAQFNGRYLRATRSFVKTHDQSEADISTLRRQHTLATDASNIYYYNLPTMKADFMACNGAVLDMRSWHEVFYQEPTRYNH